MVVSSTLCDFMLATFFRCAKRRHIHVAFKVSYHVLMFSVVSFLGKKLACIKTGHPRLKLRAILRASQIKLHHFSISEYKVVTKICCGFIFLSRCWCVKGYLMYGLIVSSVVKF